MVQLHDLMDQRVDNATNQTDDKRGHNLESVENRVHLSPLHGNLSHHQDNGSRSNGEISTVSIVNATSEFGTEKGLHIRSQQRQAALRKFLMKRKDRCFQKKVRYESRKKLAELRPRVKGQFVRQVSLSNDPPPDNSSSG